MGEIKLRPYQQKLFNGVESKFMTCRKLLMQLGTGGGKTFIFSFLSRHFIEEGKKVMILVHRRELVEQTVKSLDGIGVTGIETITAKQKSISPFASIYVGMIETVHNRIKKGKMTGITIDIVIADECHRMDFNKVIDHYNKSKILGVTATPVIQKRKTFFRCRQCKRDYEYPGMCCGIETDEWSKELCMSDYYEDIVVGPSVQELIDMGYLCQDLNYIETPANIDQLKSTRQNADGFTSKSVEEVFNNDETMFNVIKHYENHCLGKKTLIFNSNTKGNSLLYEQFVEKGYNARMYDSVNSSESERDGVVEWFDKEDDPVLLNVGCFTTGFDNCEVECIILNKATQSLSLFLQMVGRGSRISNKIYKDKFIVIDGGGNIERHQKWSSNRDWVSIFRGSGEEKEKIKKEDILDTTICKECGGIIARTCTVCPICGAEVVKVVLPKNVRDSELQVIDKVPLPNAAKIYEYTKMRGQNVNFAHKIMINQIVDLMRCYCVKKENWEQIRNIRGGRLDTIVRNVYFPLMKYQDIQVSGGRRLDKLIEMCIKKIDEFYDKVC